MNPLFALARRAARLLRSARGAFDLTSVLVGAAVVAILVGGTAVTTFGVIPWAQDNGARQNLSAVSTAQSVAKVRDGRFMTGDGLKNASYLSGAGALAVGADTNGACWVGLAKSDTGKVFYSTNDKTNPEAFATTTNPGCVPRKDVRTLAAAVGISMPNTAVTTWGLNSLSQLGYLGANSSVPVDLAAGPLANKLVTTTSASVSFTCAIADDVPYCWGVNTSGQLGNGGTTDSPTPIPVDMSGALAGRTPTAISTGLNHACTLADGSVFCWGQNDEGQLGLGTQTSSAVPIKVDGLLAGKTVTAITAGANHTCALADAKTYCWGWNSSGQLGVGDTVRKLAPTAVDVSGVLAGKDASAIDAGPFHTCAVAGGSAFCWGGTTFGALGVGDNATRTRPAAVSTAGVLSGKSVTAISAGDDTTCAVADNLSYCWGSNTRGQLGDGTTTSSPVPVQVLTSGVLAGKSVMSISAGRDVSCAVADGKIFCWGYNVFGQLGTGGTSSSPNPVPVNTSGVLAGKTASEVSVGGYHVSAIYE